MAGCSFTVNSEGLRRRAIAPKRAARHEVYIVFRSRHCQRPRRQNERCEFVDEAAIFTGSEAARQSRGTTQRPAWIGLFTHLAPHCGHIPPPFFAQSCRGRRNAGKRQRQLTFSASTVRSVDRAAAGIVLRLQSRRQSRLVRVPDLVTNSESRGMRRTECDRDCGGRWSWTKLDYAAQDAGWRPSPFISATSRRFRWRAAPACSSTAAGSRCSGSVAPS